MSPLPVVRLLSLAAFCFLAGSAHAESASTLPRGSATVYGGVGATTYDHVASGGAFVGEGNARDRAVQARLDLYGAVGLLDRLELRASVPLVYSTALGHAYNCTEGTEFCSTTTTVGTARVEGRVAVLRGPLQLAAGLQLATGAWNARYRQRYTTVGEPTTDVIPVVLVGGGGPVGAVRLEGLAHVRYAARIPTYDQGVVVTAPGVEVPKIPADDLRAGVEARLGVGPAIIELSVGTLQRLGGIDHGDWGDVGYTTEDLYGELDYDNVTVGAKLSWALSEVAGVHLGATQVVWVRNGPPDAFDVSIGVHRWFPAKPARVAARPLGHPGGRSAATGD